MHSMISYVLNAMFYYSAHWALVAHPISLISQVCRYGIEQEVKSKVMFNVIVSRGHENDVM